MQKQPKSIKMSKTILSVLILSTVVILVSVYLYQSFQIDLIMKDLHGLQQKKEQLMSETESLQARVDRMSNIDQVSKIAREKFNLEFSDDQLYVIKIDDADDLADLKKKFAQEENTIRKIKSAGIQ